MFENVGGRFEDVTASSGTGHLQKGHGVSFADWDDDGDLDLFVDLGGGYPGDRGYNVLFQNPGHGRHWLKVKLVGTQDQPLGARRQAPGRRDGPRRHPRSIHRVDRQQRQLRRQQPRRVDRPARRDVRRPPDRHLADQQDDPDLPRPRRRPGDRDHRGGRRIPRRHQETPAVAEAVSRTEGARRTHPLPSAIPAPSTPGDALSGGLSESSDAAQDSDGRAVGDGRARRDGPGRMRPFAGALVGRRRIAGRPGAGAGQPVRTARVEPVPVHRDRPRGRDRLRPLLGDDRGPTFPHGQRLGRRHLRLRRRRQARPLLRHLHAPARSGPPGRGRTGSTGTWATARSRT